MQSLPWAQTRKHQYNNSASKQTYPFVKQKRFKQKRLVLCDSFYNIPSSLGKAPAPGIGKGNKIQLNSGKENTPSPFNYNIHSQFKLDNKGIQFGIGRNKIKYNGIFHPSETPQPGRYNINDQFSRTKGFSIHKKIPIPDPLSIKNPGPGHYKSLQTLNTTGRYALSNICNTPGYKITRSKPYVKNSQIPGPGKYEIKAEQLNALGSYRNSKFENSRSRSFSRSKKGSQFKTLPPGPGAYSLVSEFGTRT